MIWITLPIPPIEEQAEIVKIIEEKISIIAAIENQVFEEIRRATRLRQSILNKAFAGKLVFSSELSPTALKEK